MGSIFKWRAVFAGVLVAVAALIASPDAEAARGRGRSHQTKHVVKKHHGRGHAHARAKPHARKPHARPHGHAQRTSKPHGKHDRPRAKR
jgi:hypothetical protein